MQGFRWANWVVVASALVGFASYGANSNEKLADAMNAMSDQYSGIADTSRKAPKDLDARAWNRVLSRARGGQWLVSIIGERSGSVVDGKLVKGELTPAKFESVSGAELENLAVEYRDMLARVAKAFASAEGELKAQAALEVTKRDFTKLKDIVKELEAARAAGHKIFRP